MRVLVSAASRYGSTAQIAMRMADDLRHWIPDAVVDLTTPSAVQSMDYHAAIIGSAVYGGHWLPPARSMIRVHSVALQRIPVWMFSSGPVGDLRTEEQSDPAELEELLAATNAREHVVFPGRIVRARLRFTERAILAALGVPDGDYREWNAIRTWTGSIAQQLKALQHESA